MGQNRTPPNITARTEQQVDRAAIISGLGLDHTCENLRDISGPLCADFTGIHRYHSVRRQRLRPETGPRQRRAQGRFGPPFDAVGNVRQRAHGLQPHDPPQHHQHHQRQNHQRHHKQHQNIAFVKNRRRSQDDGGQRIDKRPDKSGQDKLARSVLKLDAIGARRPLRGNCPLHRDHHRQGECRHRQHRTGHDIQKAVHRACAHQIAQTLRQHRPVQFRRKHRDKGQKCNSGYTDAKPPQRLRHPLDDACSHGLFLSGQHCPVATLSVADGQPAPIQPAHIVQHNARRNKRSKA